MRTGTFQNYSVIDGREARRYWVHDRILVGGEILSPEDGAHLKRDAGITHSLSLQNEVDRLDAGKFDGPILQAPIVDGDQVLIERKTLDTISTWASIVFVDLNATLYLHCQLGGARSPAVAWFLLRKLFAYTSATALALVRAGRTDFQFPPGTWEPRPGFRLSIDDYFAVPKPPQRNPLLGGFP